MLIVFRKLFHPLSIILFAGFIFLAGIAFLVFPVNKTKTLCPKCNIIVIDIDSLRKDELPCFGYHLNTTPNICRLVSSGVVFENHFSQSAWTMPNQFSFLTSVNPEIHNVKNAFIDKLDDRIITLTESLRKDGYKTAWAGYTLFTVNEDNGGLRGFSYAYPDALTSDRWQTITDEFYETYQKEKTPFFIYFYGSDLHFPYRLDSRESHEWIENIPEDYPITVDEIDKIVGSYLKDHYGEIFSEEIITAYPEIFLNNDDINGKKLMSWLWSLASATFDGTDEKKTKILSQLNWRIWKIIYDAYTENVKTLAAQKYGDRIAEFARTAYDVRLSQIDRDMKDFIDSLLTDEKLGDNTIVVLLSDHGDEFMEHGGFEHHTLYNELLRIPLIIKVPGMSQRRIKEQTQTIDVFPTLFDLVGIKIPKSAQGISLVSYMSGEIDRNAEDRYVISSTGDSVAIQNQQWKMIKNYMPQRIDSELYYLIQDPQEKENVRTQFRNVEAFLSKKLNEIRDSYGSSAN